MRLDVNCVICDIQQSVKVLKMMNVEHKRQEEIVSQVLEELAHSDYNKSNPEVLMKVWKILVDNLGVDDPYMDLKHFSNETLLNMISYLQKEIDKSHNPFHYALKLAIYGNMIDFAAFDYINYEDFFEKIHAFNKMEMAIDDSLALHKKLSDAKSCLYVADNCGEIVLDKLFIQIIKKEFPKLNIFYVVRGKPIINDVTKADAEFIKMNEYATVIENGDCLPGLVSDILQESERKIYNQCDVIISKGQGNFESLSLEKKADIFFLFMAKCQVIQKQLGINEKGMVCAQKSNLNLLKNKSEG